MNGLRKLFGRLRFLVWFALAFAMFTYVARPLRRAFWKPVNADDACARLKRGDKAYDRWGNELVYDARVGAARSPGPDKQWNTGDDFTLGCF